MSRRWLASLLAVAACDIRSPFDEPEAPCESRGVWYPDRDSDGVGEPGEVLVSCEDPGSGWTPTPPPTDTDSDA